jgi:hypothetical protein
MRKKDRESLDIDTGDRFLRMLKRMGKFAEGGPTVPWLPRYADLAAVRRTAARLRSGAMPPPHPSVDPQEAAWVLDRAVEQQRVVLDTVADIKVDRARRDELRARDERERMLRRRAAFHRLKLSPEAPAEKVRQLHRRRRRELGRPGQRQRRAIEVPLTFVVGNAQHVFEDPYGTSVARKLDEWFPAQIRHIDEEPWCSAPVEWRGWSELQQRAISLLGEESIPYLLNTDACRGVFLPVDVEACGVTHFIPGDDKILDVGALDDLIDELERFARRRVLPVDDAALLELPDKVGDGNLVLLTYAQLLRAAHYARRARLPLWVVR